MTHPDYYAILGIARDAGPDEIKRGFRVARSAAHPDRNGGNDERMKLVNRAHDCLTDPERRAVYDATGVDQPHGNEVKQLMETMIIDKAQRLLRDLIEENLHIEDDRKLLKHMRSTLSKVVANAATARDAARARSKKLSKRLGRMTVKAGQPNHVEELLSKHIEAAEEQASDAETDRIIFGKALELLDNYGTTQPEPVAEKSVGWPSGFDSQIMRDLRFFGADFAGDRA